MKQRLLTPEQIEQGKALRQQGYSKAKLALLFGVGKTTVWENIYSTAPRVRLQHKRIYRKRICIPCARCEICMTQIIKENYLPTNLQMGDICLSCFMKKKNIKFIELYED